MKEFQARTIKRLREDTNAKKEIAKEQRLKRLEIKAKLRAASLEIRKRNVKH